MIHTATPHDVPGGGVCAQTVQTRREIVLIGPFGAGKSTVSRIISGALNIQRRSLDDLRFDYYKDLGYDDRLAERIKLVDGFGAYYRHCKPFEAHGVQRMLKDYDDCVFDLGAGHTVYEDATLFAGVYAALRPFVNVVLMLPNPDPTRALRRLATRCILELEPGVPLNKHLLQSPCNGMLAKHTVYTNGKTPEQTVDEILNLTDWE
jgi:hypothetical protein